MCKKIDSDAVMEEICEGASNGIVVYGGGGYGRSLYRYLRERYSVGIKCFSVSSRQHMEQEEIEGVRVLPLPEIAVGDVQCILIIAASEQKHEEMLGLAVRCGFKNVYLLLNEFRRYIQSQLDGRANAPLERLNFEVHITEHCNLNCRGCHHFSPLAEESFLAVEEFERDLQRMQELCGDRVSSITLLGGEPLLHPQVADFLYVARRYFAEGCRLKLLTNGTLLQRMGEGFWHACAENRVSLRCTKYPIEMDYELLEETAASYGLHIIYHNDVGAGEKTLSKYPLDLQGRQPVEWNHAHCIMSNTCITLKHGRLFTCPMAAHAHLAKDYFHLDMELSDRDSIDIYRARSFGEITAFLVTPIPFCRYCSLKVRPEQQKWGVSRKEIGEWF